MAVEGAIAERLRGLLPITWDALSLDARYGDALLQTVVNTAKEYVTGIVISPTAEVTYPLVVIDYIAKVAAIQLIPAGVDFWMNQPTSVNTTGTAEVETFVDRADKLKQLKEDLLKETRLMAGDIAALVGYTRNLGRSVPVSNTINDPFLTPSPQEFPRPFTQTAFS